MAGSIPMFGRHEARILEAAAVSIHGDVYYDVLALLGAGAAAADALRADRADAIQLRVAGHLCPTRPPRRGDLVRLSFLMSQVNGWEPLAAD